MIVRNIDEELSLERRHAKSCYHYTSSEALINIVKENSLRFTHFEFLNDIEEFNYIFDLLDTEELKSLEEYDFIKKGFEAIGKDNENLLYLEPKSNGKFYRIKQGNYYVFSASSINDSLPMWSYYSKNGGYFGYSIKLDIEEIARELGGEIGDFFYGRVIYDTKEQIKIIAEKARSISNNLKYKLGINEGDEPFISEAQDELFEFLQMIRIFFKRPEFQHEKEIRIALLTNPSEKLKTGFNSVNGVVRPYIEYKFDKNLLVKEIMPSPTIEFETAQKGLMYLLQEKGYFKTDRPQNYIQKIIKKSNMKLRY